MTSAALRFANELSEHLRNAKSEEEVRAALYAAAVSGLGVKDLRLERDRQDVRRHRVIVECKRRGGFNGSSTSRLFRRACDQLCDDYIPNQAESDGLSVSDYLGICFDGDHFAFATLEPDGRRVFTDLVPLSPHSAKALGEALLTDERRSLTPSDLERDFGPRSELAQEILEVLFRQLEANLSAGRNRTVMLFSEWQDLFEQSTSLGRVGRARLGDYLSSIGLPRNADSTWVLFVLHTYHALVFKLLAAELVLANRVIPGIARSFCLPTSTYDDEHLLGTLESEIEESGLFQRVHLHNFVEGSFFAWYLEDTSSELTDAIRAALRRLALYDLTGLKLSQTRDVVKRLYQQIVPRVLRHNIGEYFTPEWLVDFVLAKAEYEGPQVLEERILDPCCGSGNFLIHAIEIFKREARSAGLPPDEILHRLSRQVMGFDLNPLAVLTARVNFVIAVADLLGSHAELEIPIYQADAVYAPSRREGGDVRTYEVGTRYDVIDLELPEDLIRSKDQFGAVLRHLEESIRRGEHREGFLARMHRDATIRAAAKLPSWLPYLRKLFDAINRLEREHDWDRIWARIIRNYFASVTIGTCRYVVGNPPWVRWSELPEAYAERIKPTCEAYGIFSEEKFFGGNELDISAIITYSVAEKWLEDGGTLAFVITKAHLQNPSSGGFRRFEVLGVPLRVESVEDFEAVRPFRELSNKPVVMVLRKGTRTEYPVPVSRWRRRPSATLKEEATWNEVEEELERKPLEAHAIGAGRRWVILPPGDFEGLSQLVGPDPDLVGRKGVTTDLNGAYFVEVVGKGRQDGRVRIRSQPAAGRKPVPDLTMDVEGNLLFPLLKGAGDIEAFRATAGPLAVIVPNRGIGIGDVPPMTDFKSRFPAAADYFNEVNSVAATGKRPSGKERGLLSDRSTWRTRHEPQFLAAIERGAYRERDVPHFAIYNVGPYTFAPYKVVWAELSGALEAAVVGTASLPVVGGRVVVPDHKVYFVAFDGEGARAHAHFVCALLNSEPVRLFADAFTVKLQVGTLFRDLRLPSYDAGNDLHRELSDLSAHAHELRGGGADVAEVRGQIDRMADAIVGVTPGE